MAGAARRIGRTSFRGVRSHTPLGADPMAYVVQVMCLLQKAAATSTTDAHAYASAPDGMSVRSAPGEIIIALTPVQVRWRYGSWLAVLPATARQGPPAVPCAHAPASCRYLVAAAKVIMLHETV